MESSMSASSPVTQPLRNFQVSPRDVDFFDRFLRDFVPPSVFDAHAHLYDLTHFCRPPGMYGICEGPERCDWQGYREHVSEWMGERAPTGALVFPYPHADLDVERANRFVADEIASHGELRGLMIVRPSDDPDRIDDQIAASGFVGFKPYLCYGERSDAYSADVAEFVPDFAWEIADRRGLVIMLHVVKDRALADPANLGYVKEHCVRYPGARLILAHCARCFNSGHAMEAMPELRGIDNVFFECSAICEPYAIEQIIKVLGPTRLMFGTDFPVCQYRGKCSSIADGFVWIRLKSFDWSDRESVIAAHNPFVGLESVYALKKACRNQHLNDGEIELIFFGTARRLLDIGRRPPGSGAQLNQEAGAILPGGPGLCSEHAERLGVRYSPDLDPKDVPKVETEYRRIATRIPVPESVTVFETLRRCEPRAMQTQAPIVWEKAEGYQVEDGYGNRWIDFTSGILVANVGHCHPYVSRALKETLDQKLLHSYLFANRLRFKLVEKLVKITPANLTKAFLLSTGSESIECALKISRLYGLQKEPKKTAVVSFAGSFHGRTMGSQMLCSSEEEKKWITSLDPCIHQIPFPRCTECPWGREHYDQCGEECLSNGLAQLERKGVDLEEIAAFIVEGYQAVRGPVFFPDDYMQALRKWTDSHEALIVVDEIQSGFGRTGKLFAYQHYGIDADLVCCGKGISSSLPLSAVLGKGQILDIPERGQMTSTHTGNPMCCAAALASIEVLERENLIQDAAEKGMILKRELDRIRDTYPDRISLVSGRGMVWGLFFVSPATKTPDIDLADRVVERAVRKGVMLFITGNGSIKICPPLTMPEEPMVEGVRVIGEAIGECLL